VKIFPLGGSHSQSRLDTFAAKQPIEGRRAKLSETCPTKDEFAASVG
jgi:hypothetical protein